MLQKLKEKYSSHIFVKICNSLAKNLFRVSQLIYLVPRKTPQNNIFIPALIIVKVEFEMYKHLLLNFHHCCHLKKIDAVLRLLFNSSPQFHSHPACTLLELQLILCKFSCCSRLCSTRTQILFKSETAQVVISKYFCLK